MNTNILILTLLNLLINLLDVLLVILPILLSVAFMTIIERKQLAAHQRRVGPNTTGYYGVLQPFSDALKLVVKETVIPSQSNKILFYLAPISSLIFSFIRMRDYTLWTRFNIIWFFIRNTLYSSFIFIRSLWNIICWLIC